MKTKRLYTSDDAKDFIHVQYKDARWPLQFTLAVNDHFVGVSRRGVPWECLLVKAAQAAAKADPNLFRHPVLYGYAEGNMLYIMVQKSRRARQLHQCVRYQHNFTKTLRKFDHLTKKQFLELFGEQGVEIKLRPPRAASKRPAGERRPSGGHRARTTKVYHGAYRRARDAGLIPSVEAAS